jgi:leucyl aminopeptidase
LKLDYLVGKDLEKEGLNLLYNVGRGASKAPVLVVIKYEGNPDHPEDVIALVGKGVCFDAGGLNIKPTGGIEEMYADKGEDSCHFLILRWIMRCLLSLLRNLRPETSNQCCAWNFLR